MAPLALLVVCAAPAATELRHTGDPACPDEEWLRADVTARLGRSPFEAGAPQLAQTKVACDKDRCEAQLELSAPGAPPRRRTLTAPPGQCRQLMESLALALAIAIDPALLVQQPAPAAPPDPGDPPPPPPPEPTRPPAARAPPPPIVLVQAETPPEPRQLRLRVSITGHTALGISPYPTGGIGAAIGFRTGWLSVSAEGRFDAPRAVEVSGGSVSSWVLLGSLVGCGHWKDLGGCLLASAGGLQVSGNFPGGVGHSSPLVLAGGRITFEHLFLPWLGLHAHLGVLAVFTRTTVYAGSQPVWATAPVTGDAALGPFFVF